MSLRHLASHLNNHGLEVRNQFVMRLGDPDWPTVSGLAARSTATLLLIGHRGGAFWPLFKRAAQPGPNPLDDWSRAVLTMAADMVDGVVVMPNDQPYQPFQRWALRGHQVFPSLLGLLIDPDAGLWHAYRGAIVLEGEFGDNVSTERVSPCDTCTDKPCLTACPVDAFSLSEPFAVTSCRAHLSATADPRCADLGCRARDACPVGREFRYSDEQIQFHMDAFARAGQKP